ncbi:ketopantoate reductase family protein [Micromonospora sp. U21]|uniref:ketopantoate reductase family protein n=1 Tax=Micromonospora sp. U21 TaxID=2824899 RepID=UPI001B390F2D|nr:2-dehydropantoate 2-reductase N-terminal domain-containing protein [Micromonospora sp. U21]MBQ0902910.1 ketopantoate reductase family protein [Micromonospora sp. U21]
MRYVIIGAGAVGGTIGVRLAEAGRDVTLVARGAHLDAIRDRGLTLRQPDGEITARLAAVDGPGDRPLPADTVLILTVKSQDTAGALAAWVDAPVAGGGTAGERLPLVTAQNGVANERAALRLFATVHPVCVWLPATHLDPGVVVANGYPYPGMLHVGHYPAGADDTDQAIADDTDQAIAADLTAAGFVAPVRPDVMRWKYGKLLANLGNGLQALLGRDIPDALAERVRAEGVAALAAARIAHTSPDEERAERGDRVQQRPVAGEGRSGGSTWQSLARGAGSTEVDHLNGEIVLLGRLHGVPTPANVAVQRAVRRAVRERIGAGAFPLAELEKMIA